MLSPPRYTGLWILESAKCFMSTIKKSRNPVTPPENERRVPPKVMKVWLISLRGDFPLEISGEYLFFQLGTLYKHAINFSKDIGNFTPETAPTSGGENPVNIQVCHCFGFWRRDGGITKCGSYFEDHPSYIVIG